MTPESALELFHNQLPILVGRVILSFFVGAFILRVTCWLNNLVVRRFALAGKEDAPDDSQDRRAIVMGITFSPVSVPSMVDAFYLLLLSLVLFFPLLLVAGGLMAILHLVPGIKLLVLAADVIVGFGVFWFAHAIVLRLLLTTEIRQACKLALVSSIANIGAVIGITALIAWIPWDYLMLVYRGLTT